MHKDNGNTKGKGASPSSRKAQNTTPKTAFDYEFSREFHPGAGAKTGYGTTRYSGVTSKEGNKNPK